MAERTGVCALCNQVKPVKELRYNRNESGHYEYQCSACRKRIKGAEAERGQRPAVQE